METPYTFEDAKRHMAVCATFSHANADAMARTIFLAVSSIRIHSKRFWREILPKAYETYKETGSLEETSKRYGNFLALSFKRECIAYVFENKEAIFKAMKEAESAENAYLWLIENVPGLGIAKAGFVVQMIFNRIGCLDAVNLKRFGISAKIRTPAQYLSIVAETGEDAVTLWKNWCETVAARDGMNALELSSAHARFVALGSYDSSKL